jgi:hypothetical protein
MALNQRMLPCHGIANDRLPAPVTIGRACVTTAAAAAAAGLTTVQAASTAYSQCGEHTRWARDCSYTLHQCIVNMPGYCSVTAVCPAAGVHSSYAIAGS